MYRERERDTDNYMCSLRGGVGVVRGVDREEFQHALPRGRLGEDLQEGDNNNNNNNNDDSSKSNSNNNNINNNRGVSARAAQKASRRRPARDFPLQGIFLDDKVLPPQRLSGVCRGDNNNDNNNNNDNSKRNSNNSNINNNRSFSTRCPEGVSAKTCKKATITIIIIIIIIMIIVVKIIVKVIVIITLIKK